MNARAHPTWLFDARVIQDHFPGIGRYALNLLRALPAQLRPDERLIVLHDPGVKNTRQPWQPADHEHPQVSFIEHRVPLFGMPNLRAAPAAAGATLAHYTYYVRPLTRRPRSITALYDAISFVYPQGLGSARTRLLIRFFHLLAAQTSDAFVTLSEDAARDVARFFPRTRGRTFVTPLAADAVFKPQPDALMQAARARHDLPARFALYLASNKPHKNLPRLIEAWAAVKDDAPLVIAGHQDPRYPEAQQRAQALGLAGRVRFVGPIPDADAAALYSACGAFVYPSLYEGFGLTPLEAMACGAPVICGDVSSLPEVVGDAAVLVDPYDPRDIAAALTRLLSDPALQLEMRAGSLRQAAQFSWARTAALTLDAYRAVAAGQARHTS